MNIKRIIKNGILFTLTCLTTTLSAKDRNEYLPNWKQGYMDIHQIATGRGNAAFAILPDGTTMLIDAGDFGDRAFTMKQEIMPPLPNNSKQPGEWIALYIKHFTAPLKRSGKLDYAFMTHFHNDHMGGVSKMSRKIEGRDFSLIGVTEVAEHLAIDKFIDRGWPDYNYPTEEAVRSSNPAFQNYLNFIKYQREERSTDIEKFKVGLNDQFTLKYNPQKYTNFEIHNIYSSGEIWAGEGNITRQLFPPIDSLKATDYPNENMCSNAIKITYGNFGFFTGGDITGAVWDNKTFWRDIETHVGRVVGPVDVAVLDHHGYSDSMVPSIISSFRPKAFVIGVWDFYHPQPDILERLLDKTLYPDDRSVFATGLVPGNKERMGELAKNIKPYGHIVTRVYNGGTTFQIFVLDAHSTDYNIIYKTEVFKAGTNR